MTLEEAATAPTRPTESTAFVPDQTSRRRRRWTNRASSVVYPIISTSLFLLAWAVLTATTVPAYLLPPPTTVLQTVWERRELLLFHGLFTTQETILGFLVSAVIGIALSLLLYSSAVLNKMIYPLLVATQSMPRVAVAPLFVVWLGFGLPAKVVIAFLMAFFPVVINTTIGLQSVPREMLLLAASTGAGPWRTFWKVRVPHALPSIVGGLKVAITLAVVGAVVGEFVGADRGLGYLVQVGSGTLNVSLMFAAVLSLMLLGMSLFLIVEGLEYWLLPGPRRLKQAAGRE